jgi:DNA-binding transcriptional LysR family regulator
MDTKQLRHFVAVAEEQNFSAAAKRVHLSQPGLTRSIKSLEQALNSQLFERGPLGTTPTTAGIRLLEHARMILSDCARATQDIAALRNGVSGEVRFGIAALFTAWVGDTAVERIGVDLPDVSLTVFEGFFEDLIADLMNGRIDFALTNLPPVPLDPSLVVEEMLDLKARVVCGAVHPLARRRNLQVADLVQSRWVNIDRPHSVEVFRQYFVEQGAPVPQVTSTDSLALLRSLVTHGTHLAIVVEPVVHRELRRGLVKALRVPTPPLRRRAALVYVKRPSRPSAIERVMDIVRSCCGEAARASKSPSKSAS